MLERFFRNAAPDLGAMLDDARCALDAGRFDQAIGTLNGRSPTPDAITRSGGFAALSVTYI